ncbi:MAG: hypothetical protein JXB32_25435 [Deltaproteobacteria bacterium]|nr:hypothetical protein [Deltaproteobacteria bacterium]
MNDMRSGFCRRPRTGRRTIPLVLAGLCLGPGLAAAQVWSPAVPVGCPDAPADPGARRALAGEFFSRGMTADETGDHEAAASAYACCFHITPHPNTLYNLALSAEKAGDVRTAQHALERYIAEAPGALNLGEAAGLLATVSRRVAELPPEEPPPDEPPPDEPPPDEPPPTPAVSGPAVPAVTPQTPPDDGPSVMAIAGWSLLGGGLAIGVAGGAAFGVLADQEADAVEGSEPGTPWTEIQPHLVRHDDYQTAEIAMLAVGGAVLAAGIVLLIVDAAGESSAEAGAVVVPLAGDGVGGLALAGWF